MRAGRHAPADANGHLHTENGHNYSPYGDTPATNTYADTTYAYTHPAYTNRDPQTIRSSGLDVIHEYEFRAGHGS